ICDVNSNRVQGSTGKADWFDLSKHERKELREFYRIKSPNISQQIYSELDSFLSDQPDTTPLAASFPAQPRFSTDDAQPSGNSSVFGDNETDTSADRHNTGRKNNKRKRSDKYEKLREVLDQRSEATLAQARLLHDEELTQRRQQHVEHMKLMRAFLDKF
ncbi:Plasma membrane protein, partial [Phytophthora megakarya]